MSILASLARAYERLPDAPPFGFSSEKIGFLISLNDDGTVAHVVDLRDGEGKKKQPLMMLVPQPVKRTAGISPNTFWDKTSYVLGVTAGEGRRTADEHAAFVKHHLDLLAGTEDAGLLAFSRFLSQWTPEQFELLNWPEDMKDQNVIFALESDRLDRIMLHDRPAAKALWARVSGAAAGDAQICLVTGEAGPVARLHPSIKGVWGAQSSGAALVSFNLDAFTSYGHEQGSNAPVSEAAAFAYTTALNRFLEKDSRHRIQIGDASTVFWADSSKLEDAEAAESLFSAFWDPQEEDAAATKKIGIQLERIRHGEQLEKIEPDLEKGVDFYVLGLAPNAARLSVRFWLQSDFSEIARNYEKYCDEIYLLNSKKNPPPLGRLLLETVLLSPKDRRFLNGANTKWRSVMSGLSEGQQKFLGLLYSDCMYSILTGKPYPLTLLGSTIARIRTDKIINDERMALIKAVLIRNFIRPLPEAAGKHSRKELFVALDRTEPDPAYVLGRLFAILEKIQELALGKLNANIKSKYFGAASSTPHAVFPMLLRLNVHHQGKAEKDAKKRGLAIYFEQEKREIMNLLKPDFPRFLQLKDQGKFFLGYEHQMYSPKKPDDNQASNLAHSGENN